MCIRDRDGVDVESLHHGEHGQGADDSQKNGQNALRGLGEVEVESDQQADGRRQRQRPEIIRQLEFLSIVKKEIPSQN